VGSPRICLGPREVAGYYGQLTAALRRLGVDALHVNLAPHPFGYPEGPGPPLGVRLAMSCRRWRLGRALAAVPILLWALVRFDVFVFGSGQSFLGLRDLALLRLLRKRVIFVLHGSDARPPYMNGAVTRRPWNAADVIDRTRAQKRRLARIERYANAVISDPTYCQLLENPIVLRGLIGRPVSSVSPRLSDAEPARRLRVLHAPSDPVGKGTAEIRRIFSRLQARGHDVELIVIAGEPNAVVLDEIARCDFVADQLYTDMPMATFATEAARFGKPALVGGYASEHYRAAVPAGTVPPALYVDPSEFEAAAERMLSDPQLRRRLGREAREFVRSHWTASDVAKRLLRVVSGDVPPEWGYDPSALRYTHGYGLTDDQVRELVRAVVHAGGVQALQVADKPELERSLVELASGTA
jgi:glycosyltransferase involved in cell wall biosynthesis